MAPTSPKVHILEGMKEPEKRADGDAAAFESVQAFLDFTSGYKVSLKVWFVFHRVYCFDHSIKVVDHV
jgi:hypothetical protein